MHFDAGKTFTKNAENFLKIRLLRQKFPKKPHRKTHLRPYNSDKNFFDEKLHKFKKTTIQTQYVVI